MADEFDGCECIWNHEVAMRRLLTWLRQGQSQCTDTECFDLVRPNNNSNTNSDDGDFTFMTMFTILAVILYFIRPSAVLGRRNDARKPPPGGEDPNNGPPPTVN